MSLRLVIQPQHCIGCRACEMACAFTHGTEGQPAASRCVTVTLDLKAENYVPMICLQCDHAACVTSCPSGAISRSEETQVVYVDQQKCIRCMACTVACPFGNMHFDPAQKQIHKCDLCAGCGDYPRCAMFCPTKCLSVE